MSGYATPTFDDLHTLDSLLLHFPAENASILSAAIDWFNRGSSSLNVFTRFLCYYISFESLALAIEEGKINLPKNHAPEAKIDRLKRRHRCIESKYEKLFHTDPVRFVSESYFECVLGLKEKTRRVAESVFGIEHLYVKRLFERSVEDGLSLNDIRGKLAHGVVTLHKSEHESLVSQRVHEIQQISKEFITRVTFGLGPYDPVPTWSGLFAAHMSFADPRSIMFATDDQVLSNKDWRIRPEWCD